MSYEIKFTDKKLPEPIIRAAMEFLREAHCPEWQRLEEDSIYELVLTFYYTDPNTLQFDVKSSREPNPNGS